MIFMHIQMWSPGLVQSSPHTTNIYRVLTLVLYMTLQKIKPTPTCKEINLLEEKKNNRKQKIIIRCDNPFLSNACLPSASHNTVLACGAFSLVWEAWRITQIKTNFLKKKWKNKIGGYNIVQGVREVSLRKWYLS